MRGYTDKDIPEGKWELCNGGTTPKPHAPKVSSVIRSRTQEEMDIDHSKAKQEQRGNDNHDVAAGCFNGEAMVLLADGTLKQAQHIVVGDMLATSSGASRTTRVEACVEEAQALQRIVKIGNLLITTHHPVVRAGRWVRPLEVEDAELIEANIRLYNFITTDCAPIVVENFIATSIGTFCEGLHDLRNPEHRIWGTRRIVDIYREHPDWPHIVSTSEETIAAVAAAAARSAFPIWGQAAQGLQALPAPSGCVEELRVVECR